MKRIKAAVSLLGLLAMAVCSARGQTFMNLDFEDATIQYAGSPNWLDWNYGAPGWNHNSGEDTTVLFYQQGHLGTSQIYYLVDSTSPTGAPGALDGFYSLAFASGYFAPFSNPSSPWTTAYISQTGLIPGGTKSLRLLATGPFSVSVGGVGIPMASLGGNLYGGDISGFAGSVAELKIMNTAPVGYVHILTTVDDINFSPTAVPEPPAVSLAVVGAAAWFVRRGSRWFAAWKR